MRQHLRARVYLVFPVVVLMAVPFAVELSAAADLPDTLFQDRVAPIFSRQCLSCHNDATRKGDFSLETRKALETSGHVEPGDPDASQLMEMIVPLKGKAEMPKDAAALQSDEIASIRQWIAAGAPWPDGYRIKPHRVSDANWWSLMPLKRPPVPTPLATDAPWVRTPIDAFVLQKLRANKLAPSPEADRGTLIRRLYFDLVGLPPTPQEVEAFLADTSPDAYERLVDRLLASPRFGERWARHWLDVVHYGDTHGYDKDKLRPNAWPYRDYVIRAFNEDKPYDRFVQEQLAGDVLWPDSRDGVVATGFMAAGPFDWVGHVELGEDQPDKRITRNLDRDDMVATTMNTFVSLTVQCSRCHNHKFDPVTMEDYYSLQAVFAAVDRADRPYPVEDSTRQLLASLENRWKAWAKTKPHGPGAGKHEATLAEWERAARPAAGMVYAAATQFKPHGEFRPTKGKPRPIHVLARGNEREPQQEVGPGTLSCIAGLDSRFSVAKLNTEGDRRVALAKWITDRRNPLTWRSIVNRVWQYHFGSGLVASSNDFGRMGDLPTHPELLDWLASGFRDGETPLRPSGSLKALHRLIVVSSVYRQSAASRTDFSAIDNDNRYLWRANRRRLEAEAIHDAQLAAAGKLDTTMYGPGYLTFGLKDDHSPHYLYEQFNPDNPLSHRRSIYRFVVRSAPDPFMETLDCADPSLSVPRRNETITPLSALAMWNNAFALRMAENLAARAVAEHPQDVSQQVALAFRLALGRRPQPEEQAALVRYARGYSLAAACRVIFNMNEFVFVD